MVAQLRELNRAAGPDAWLRSAQRTLQTGLGGLSELAAAFRGLAATVEKLFNISCVVDSDEDLVIADRAVVNHLFRLAQEAINNSVKHGQAKRVVIGLKAVGAKTSLTIQDNGLGFRRDSSQPKGLGLRIMNYRAQKIGATFDIQPAEGGGTIVTCSLPA